MFVTASQQNDFWCSIPGHHQDDGDLIMNMTTGSRTTLNVIMLMASLHACWNLVMPELKYQESADISV